ncbi:MAG: 4Fe-4S binding protein [Ignavibacteria bacterium]|nr:4Fe-4S binding protein [Ignavibacteria bacterium]
MDLQDSRKTYRILRNVRAWIVAGLGGILANSYFPVVSTKQIYDGPLKQGCVPFLNCHACPTAFMACPIGILQHFAAIGKLPLALFGFLGGVGMTFGRSACGWLCPFGWIQDQLNKIKSPKIGIPAFLKQGKYVSLVVLAILLPYFTEEHWFSRICPWGTLSAGIPWMIWNPIDPAFGVPVIEPGMVGWLYVLKISILVLFLTLFVLSKRPFCRTLCPLGAIYSLFNRVSFMRMAVEGKCADCDLCLEVCPVDIRIADDPNSPDCIRCLKCTVCKNVHVRWGPIYESRTKTIATTSTEG